MVKVLVVDDEEPFRRLLKKELTRKGFFVETASDGGEALNRLNEASYDVILLDIVMPGIDGISLMNKIRELNSQVPAVVVLTGKATIETAVRAMRNGAYDYLTKPYKLDELVIVVNRAYEFGMLRMQNKLLQQELVRKESPEGFIAESGQLKEIFSLIRKTAPTDSPVLIQGESGTGKELIANTLWQSSKRNSMPFIALNCASFSESLIESELFGHEKGAFTSAYQTKHGIVEVADKGTLFLDEIAEMPIGLQAKLLRFLDSGEFRRVGGNKTLSVDVRVVAATNKDLRGLIAQKTFREDLFYRLNVINIMLPPLRERKDDIPALSRYFLKKYSKKISKQVSDLSLEAYDLLASYDWPGNVRELENVIERALILCDSDILGREYLAVPAGPDHSEKNSLASLEHVEKDYIVRVLQENSGNQTKTSQVLGIDRKTLYLKMKKYGITT